MLKRSSSSSVTEGEEETEEELELELVAVVLEVGIVEEISLVRGPRGSLWACRPWMVTSRTSINAWMENIVAGAAVVEQRLAYNTTKRENNVGLDEPSFAMSSSLL